MSLTPAEQKVRKLAKLSGNCTCANCGTQQNHGFSTVCIKFHTFVCNMCKTSHQAISHRCKSLTMSRWTDDEVSELERKGNDYARRTWLKNAPPIGTSGRPRKGDDVNVFKRFVVQVYEYKRYYGEDDGLEEQDDDDDDDDDDEVSTSSSDSSVEQPRRVKLSNQRTSASSLRQVPKVTARSSAPAPVVADLLDFSAPSVPSQLSNTSANAFQPSFDAFESPSPAPATPAVVSDSTNMFDPDFGDFQSGTNSFQQPAPTSAPAASGFGFTTETPRQVPVAMAMSNGNGSMSTTAFSAPFHGLATMSTPSGAGIKAPSPNPAAETRKKQVMSNMSFSTNANAISYMNIPQTNQQGFHNSGMVAQNYMKQQQQANMMQQQQLRMMQQQKQQSCPMMGMQVNGGMNNPMFYQQQQMAMMQNQRAMQQNVMQMSSNSMGNMGRSMDMNSSLNSSSVDPFMMLNANMMGSMKKK